MRSTSDVDVERIVRRCRAAGVNPGYPLGRTDPARPDGLLVAITELTTRARIDRLAEVLASSVAAERAAGGRGKVPA
jgi:hypothetical protein